MTRLLRQFQTGAENAEWLQRELTAAEVVAPVEATALVRLTLWSMSVPAPRAGNQVSVLQQPLGVSYAQHKINNLGWPASCLECA